jgi:hypothetical protein
MNDNPLAKLGELSKPATVLIEKISDAVGGIFRPYQIVRVAKAEAEADRIRAESQIQTSDLHRRAMHRFLEEEAKKQSNIEGITQKAIPLIDDSASPEQVNDDWITNFFDKCRIISDEEMQLLWSKILAGVANSPGTFSRKTVNLLADLDKGDAELFAQLCRFGWMIGDVVPLVHDVQAEIYNKYGINFDSLSHLESLGLIQFSNIAGFQRLRLPKKFQVFYYGRPVEITMPKESDNILELGKVLLTKAGQELAPVSGSQPIEEFFDFVYDKWAKQSYVPKRETEHL